MPLFFLVPHPATPCSAVTHHSVEVSCAQSNILHLCYVITGNISSICIPDVLPQQYTDGLWQHTCFEVFIAAPDKNGYYEWNFSPSTEWAAYRFSAYRAGQVAMKNLIPPHITRRFGLHYFQLEVVLHLPDCIKAKGPVALSAVVNMRDNMRSYWAYTHPSTVPDFHHPDNFVLYL